MNFLNTISKNNSNTINTINSNKMDALLNNNLSKINKNINMLNKKIEELTNENTKLNTKLNIQYTLLLDKTNDGFESLTNMVKESNSVLLDEIHSLHKKNNILVKYISDITSEYMIVNKENEVINELYSINNLI
jgi:predicted  nucleic acid-binding Zn-ribbon protein